MSYSVAVEQDDIELIFQDLDHSCTVVWLRGDNAEYCSCKPSVYRKYRQDCYEQDDIDYVETRPNGLVTRVLFKDGHAYHSFSEGGTIFHHYHYTEVVHQREIGALSND